MSESEAGFRFRLIEIPTFVFATHYSTIFLKNTVYITLYCKCYTIFCKNYVDYHA
ncbi:hypothetical protein GCM10022296_12450 [Secundilactobacillus similis DSM 23365 = JCM 2765]